MQQGRVTVEADWNEEEQVVNEEMRKEALDFVGHNGTPDNGYRIDTGQALFDFSVSNGTMYVGGMRAFLAESLQYSDQSDWLDHSGGDPDWVDVPTLGNAPPQREFIYLYLREQEVSAVEDLALREVALGGPDTAQRVRLIQHIVRLKTDPNTNDCATALAAARTKWAAEGLNCFDGQTVDGKNFLDGQPMRLMSTGKLQIIPDGVTTPVPCEPQAHGGYLGADNQLIRIQITGSDPAANTYSLVWGFDNASFLYRVEVVDNQTLKLVSRPLDDLHNPRAGQAVEVLRSAARLGHKEDIGKEDTVKNYIASATGIVKTLAQNYARDTQSIKLPNPLPTEYLDKQQTPVLFLRVWEEEETNLSPDTAVLLGQTGLKVTCSGPFHVGDHWLIAVRPNTAADPNASTKVFPQRYLEGPQPPDGPRLWACPLALVAWDNNGNLKSLDGGDCRNQFDGLVELTKRKNGGCCNVTVRPEDLTGTTTLQTIIDKKLATREQATVCLTPGVYSLPEPLRLGPDKVRSIPDHSNLTLESCHGGVTIQAAAGHEDKFLDGLIVLNGTENVTLRGLQFNLPLTPIPSGGTLAHIRTALKAFGGVFPRASVGIQPVNCYGLTIRDCHFIFSTDSDPNIADADITGYGILAIGRCQGLTVQGNTFERLGPIQIPGEIPIRSFVGYNLETNAHFTSGLSDTTIADTIPAGGLVRPLLQDASFQDNLFSNISTAIVIAAQTEGIVKVVNNTVENCLAGFKFASDTSNALAALVDEVFVPREQLALAQRLRASLLSMTQDPTRLLASVLARVYPLPSGVEPIHTIQVEKQESSKTFELGKAKIQMFFDKALSLFSKGPLDVAAEKVSVKEGAIPPPREVGRLNALHMLLSAFERAALLPVSEGGPIRPFGPGPVPPFSLYVSGNDIATIGLEARVGQFTAPAFDVNHPHEDSGFDVNMSANKMQKPGPGPTVSILGGRCVITGNLVLNGGSPHADGYIAISLSPDDSLAVAITGNLFVGNVSLPDRNFPPPLNTWDSLNTVLNTVFL
jgi:hypothetical protein